jgi:lipoprotein-anchoring transpeptidase ErfK/SrfK
MNGRDVRRLQERLAQLAYYPGARDGRYGADTEEAVWAFEEVQNMPASGTVTVKVERALVNPRYPTPLVPRGGALRVEVSLGRHVLYVYRSNKIVLISHISSGGGYYYCDSGCSYAMTPTGNFRTMWRVKGWHIAPLGELYNPVFFYGGYAIHGDTYVPVQPVSHGCVRIPMDVANIFPGMVPSNGIPVYVRATG